MKLTIAVIATIFCVAYAVPVPEPEESIDLVKIPLGGDKVSKIASRFALPISDANFIIRFSAIIQHSHGNTYCFE